MVLFVRNVVMQTAHRGGTHVTANTNSGSGEVHTRDRSEGEGDPPWDKGTWGHLPGGGTLEVIHR